MSDRQITSRHNPRIISAARLRDRRTRQREGRILIDGLRELRRALAAGVELESAFIAPELCRSEISATLAAELTQAGAEVWTVTPEVLERIAFGERAEGIVGVARAPRREFVDLRIPANSLIAVLVGIEKPGNVGAVVRTADGAGVGAVIVADGRTDLFNPNAIRASLGTLFSLPVCAAETAATHQWLVARGRPIYAARVGASLSYTEVDYRAGAAIVLGSEAAGLGAEWIGPEVTPISIPLLGTADSLNVSVAAAVVFYEALRQRGAG